MADADLTFILKIIDDELKKNVKGAIQSAQNYGRKRALDIRDDIIKDWFGEFDSKKFVGRKVNKVKATRISGTVSARLEIKTWTSQENIESFESADRWLSKEEHSEYNNKESNIFVSDLIFDEGIIGLPKEASIYKSIYGHSYNGRGWKDGINQHHHQKSTPLSKYIENDTRWIDFENELADYILSKIE